MLNFTKIFIGRKISQFQRNFPYLIKQEIIKMPRILTQDSRTQLVVLAQHKTFVEGLWTAGNVRQRMYLYGYPTIKKT
ncbi:MAG: hypothetical protein ACIWVG_31130, partial [Gloeotrichia echinulata HAB0833]